MAWLAMVNLTRFMLTNVTSTKVRLTKVKLTEVVLTKVKLTTLIKIKVRIESAKESLRTGPKRQIRSLPFPDLNLG